MNKIKQVIAKMLALAVILTTVDLSWCDLTVYAANVTDAYDAYNNIIGHVFSGDVDAASKLNLNNVTESLNETANASVENLNWDNKNSNSTGIWTYNQNDISATAQVKSGEWLTNTHYEAMSGTPTTEDLFITMGGTQWIVELQYRLVSAPYTRTYHFDASAANYRYYTLGDVTHIPASTVEDGYSATVEVPYDEDPEPYTGFTNVNGTRSYNYAYKSFEGLVDDADFDEHSLTSVSGVDLGGDAYSFTYCAKDEEYGGFSASTLHPGGVNVNVNTTNNLTPNQVKAALFREEAYNAISEWKALWDNQDDNYRADQGAFNVDEENLFDKQEEDVLSFMYTYGGMARKGTIKGNGQASNGNTYYSDSIWTPALVTYFYDWQEYYSEDSMDSTYGSTSISFQTLGETGVASNTEWYKYIAEDVKLCPSVWNPDTQPADAYKSKFWTLNPTYWNPVFIGAQNVGGNTINIINDVTIDMHFAQRAEEEVGANICVALNDVKNAYAFGAQLSSDAPEGGSYALDYLGDNAPNQNMSLNTSMVDQLFLVSDGMSMGTTGYNELAYLYYRGCYAILLEYGPFLYADEANELFYGLPGFKTVTNTEEYNRIVSENLAAVFGQPDLVSSTEKDTITTVFAIFPNGGDLDGGMEDDYSNKNSHVSEEESYYILESGAAESSYMYKVTLSVSLTGNQDYTGDGSVTEQNFYTTRHYEKTPELPAGGLPCTESLVNGVLPNHDGECRECDYCDGRCWNSCTASNCKNGHVQITCTTCGGNGIQPGTTNTPCSTCRQTGKIYKKCGTCGGDGLTGANNDVRCFTCGGNGKVKCSTCGGDGKVDCSHCGGDGEVECSDDKLSSHTHYGVPAGGYVFNQNHNPIDIGSHDIRVYTETYMITSDHSVVINAGQWSDIKSMSDSQIVRQTFDNVQWLDITHYRLWQFNKGTVRGLAKILASPVSISEITNASKANAGDDSSNNYIVTEVLDELGYTVYNVDDSSNGLDLNSYTVSNNKWNVTRTLTDLESKYGRVANSFWQGSYGNFTLGSAHQAFTYRDSLYTGSKNNLYAYRKSDCPALGLDLDDNPSRYSYVNDDVAAYKYYDTIGDDIYFVYSPYSQGGRSHTTFGGFVTQALAHTLYWKYTTYTDGSFTSDNNAVAYGNSLRVQGDYLTLYKTTSVPNSANSYLTLAGMYYDTWNERFLNGDNSTSKSPSSTGILGQGYDDNVSSGKFALVPDGSNNLTHYLSSMPWIPGRLSTCIARSTHDQIYQSDVLSCMNSCFMIHTYCRGINGDYRSSWDSLATPTILYAFPDPYSLWVGGKSDLASINVKHTIIPKPWKVHQANYPYAMRLSSLVDNGDFNYMSSLWGSNVNGLSNGYEITVNITDYLQKNMNTDNIMTLDNITMPYVGYQSDGNGTADITQDGANGTQCGYNGGTVTNFTFNNTFVSSDSNTTVAQAGTQAPAQSLHGTTSAIVGASTSNGFIGFNLYPTQKVYQYNTVVNNNVLTTSDGVQHQFTAKYPWLTSLNISRYLPNNEYTTGVATADYKQVSGNVTDGSSGSNPSIIAEQYRHVDYTSTNASTLNSAVTADSGKVSLHVPTDYTRNTNSYDGQLNNIVVYNPVSTETAMLCKLSDYLPDASNTGTNEDGDYSYNGAYLKSYLDLVYRDTRTGYAYTVTSGDNENYISSSGVLTQHLRNTNKTKYTLKDTSDEETKAYTDSNYQHSEDFSVDSLPISQSDSIIDIQNNGTYLLTVQTSSSAFASVKADLQSGDKLKVDAAHTVLLEPANSVVLYWDSFKSAFKSLKETSTNETVLNWTDTNLNTGFPAFKDTTMYIGATGNESMYLRKGQLIEFTLVTSATSDAAEAAEAGAIKLDQSCMTNANLYTKEEVSEDNKYRTFTWYIEATANTLISNLKLTFNSDCFVWSRPAVDVGSANSSFITCDDIVLYRYYNGDAELVTTVSTYDYFYSGRNFSSSEFLATNFYNNYACTIVGEHACSGTTVAIEAGKLYCKDSVGTVSYGIDYSSLTPHMVPNTDWRYYVLGWTTNSGKIITSVEDSSLYNSTVVLNTPAGGTITVGELISYANSGKLLVAQAPDGTYNLLTDDTYANKKSDLTGMYITSGSYNTVCFATYAEDAHYVANTIFGTSQHAGATTISRMPASDGTITIGSEQYKWYDLTLDVVFEATSGTTVAEVNSSSNIAYDVKWSHSLLHRWSTTDTLHTKDWDETVVQEVTFDATILDDIMSDYVSLDDEFVLYWDNYTSLNNGSGTLASNVLSTTTTLGRGWDNLTDSQCNNTNCLISSHADNFDNYSKQVTAWNDKLLSYNTLISEDNDVTDTTKWIYNKYVVFNVDMYAFTDVGYDWVYDDSMSSNELSSKHWNPTTPAYKSNGDPNNIVYIPAGEKVYLGYYVGDKSNDNTGLFYDYGCSNVTKDPNGQAYAYHFWCPLSNGELDNIGTIMYVVDSINSHCTYKTNTDWKNTYASNNGNINSSNYSTTATKQSLQLTTEEPHAVFKQRSVDEWGDAIYDAYALHINNNSSNVQSVRVDTSNENSKSFVVDTMDRKVRYGSNVSYDTFSIVGRLGGLTVLDSGDPRYQDTFKVTSDSDDWAVSPIVKAVTSYSNQKGASGSQNYLLTDPVNVRGRLVMKSYSDHDNVENNIQLYAVNPTGGYKNDAIDLLEYKIVNSGDTYASATWYVQSLANTFSLPLTSDFNIHKEIRNSLTMTKLGYELYCTMSTIGNYYGSSGKRNADTVAVNNNLDNGQTKLQIHPLYVGYDANTGDFFPVDVYMRQDSSYALINAGSAYASESEADVAGSSDPGPYYLDDCFDATYTSSIDTNTNPIDGNHYVLDQNMLRRSITDIESNITFDILHGSYNTDKLEHNGYSEVTTSILDSNTYSAGYEIGMEGLDYTYVYGNAQMLFLREWNRTFIGGTTLAINQKETSDQFVKLMLQNAKLYAQRWYFGVGLPASAVFVEHGAVCKESTILNGKDGYYVLCLLDSYAIGEKWVIHYESALSGETITINGQQYSANEYNVYKDKLPYAIPVCMYDLSQTTSSGDRDTMGSH